MSLITANRAIHSKANSRPGNVTLFFLAFMLVTVPALLLALNTWRIEEAKVSQQRMNDAAAHAAALALTDEVTKGSTTKSPLLYGDPTEIKDLLINRCIPAAIDYASMNYVDGMPIKLDTSTPDKDVKFGIFDFNAATPKFIPLDILTTDILHLRAINAVRVNVFRDCERKNAVPLFGPNFIGGCNVAQIVTQTTAALDRRVIGFRIQEEMTAMTFQTVPLAPVALLSTHLVGSPPDTRAWEYQVEINAKPGNGAINPIAYGTMVVRIPTSTNGSLSSLNSVLLDIGAAGSVATLNNQLLGGITKTQMSAYTAAFPKGLILDPSTFMVDIPKMAPPAPNSKDFNDMLAAFQTLLDKGAERAWPLWQTFNGSNVSALAFVGARVIHVSTPLDGGGNPYIQLVLQPTLMETPTAFTDYSNRFLKTATPPIPNSGPPTPYANYPRIVNPYICRIRMVD